MTIARLRRSLQSAVGVAAVLGLALCSARCGAEITDKHREFAQSVLDQMLPHVEQPESWDVWPPSIRVTEPGYANAFASYETKGDQRVPFIVVTVKEIEAVAEFNPDALAFSVGHELGHLVHDDLAMSQRVRRQVGSSQLTLIAVGREQELAADMYGLELAMKAGFKHSGLMKNLRNTMRQSHPYCSFEGLDLSHPSWQDRSAFLQQDDNQKLLWRSMSEFSNGVFFLRNEQFQHAEFCFLRVTMEFPECYEAWANLGYARLMQYCDLLEPEDVRRFEIGHLVVGGFYGRPDSLAEQTRTGIDEALWFDAVGALREALRLKQVLGLEDDLTLVKANLAIAYLVHPSGQKDVGQAGRLFDEVFESLGSDSAAQSIDPLVRAAILVNAGAGRGDVDPTLLENAARELARLANRSNKSSAALQTLGAALDYTKAKTLARSSEESDRQSAVELFENYLRRMSPACAWWPLAYEQYAQLAAGLGLAAVSQQQLSAKEGNAWRPVTHVAVSDELHIGLSEPIADVLERLGEPDDVRRVVAGTRISLYRYDDHGLSILASGEVLAVLLTDQSAPEVPIQRSGFGAEPTILTVGMPQEDIEGLLGSGWDVDSACLYDPTIAHQLYRDVGLAVRYADGRVSELVVVMVPRAGGRK